MRKGGDKSGKRTKEERERERGEGKREREGGRKRGGRERGNKRGENLKIKIKIRKYVVQSSVTGVSRSFGISL
jgi:hypothetical protein